MKSRHLLLLFGLGILIAVVKFADWRNQRVLEEAAELRKRSFESILTIKTISEQKYHAETLAREYVVTGDESLREQAEKASGQVLLQLANLHRLGCGSALEQQRIDKLDATMRERIEHLRHTLQARKTQGFEAAQSVILDGRGRQLSHLTTVIIQELETEKRRVLEQRDDAVDESFHSIQRLTTLGSLVTLVLVVVAISGLERENRRRTAAYAALDKSEQSLAITLDSIGDAVLATDAQRRVVRINPVAEKLTGWTQADALGRPINEVFQIINEATRQPAVIPVDDVLATGAIHELANHTALIARDGTERAIADSAAPIRDKKGKITGVVLVFRDVTEERRAENRLRESEAKLRDWNARLENIVAERTAAMREAQASLDGTDDGVFIFQPDTLRFSYVNSGAARLLGYPRAELLEKTALELKSEPERDKLLSVIAQMLRGGKTSHRFESVERCKDGREVPVENNLQLVSPGSGSPRFIAIVRDRSEQRRLETQLRQAQKMEAIGQLAGGVAHDFNNILAAMMMQIDLAMEEKLPPGPREMLVEIRRATERAADLTRRLLLFSRRQVMQPRRLDLNEVVTSMARMLQRIVREDVRLELHLNPTPLFLQADHGMLDQALMNLAVNARDAMLQGGRLVIQTHEKTITAEQARLFPDATPGRCACLIVSDTGSGIPPEIMPHIFEPFFTTKEPGKGTGLGLATVFGIIKQHRGWLTVSSEPGVGTTFKIFLPILPAENESSANEAAKGKPCGGSETILLVEDDQTVRRMTRFVLQRHGYAVLEAIHGADALKIWSEHRADIAVLLTDLVMPEGISGLELARRLQTDKANLKVIFTTGYSADIAGHNLNLKTGQNFVPKPYSPEHLLETIRSCLDQPARAQAAMDSSLLAADSKERNV